MHHMYPDTLTFAIFSREVPRPTLTIRRDGTLKPRDPSLYVQDATVLLECDDDSIDLTAKQYRAMVQLVRIALHGNAFARIIFNDGASPWGHDWLRGVENGMTVREAMRIRPVHISKVLMRRKPRHPVIVSRQKELRGI
jgi:hypothetical protein